METRIDAEKRRFSRGVDRTQNLCGAAITKSIHIRGSASARVSIRPYPRGRENSSSSAERTEAETSFRRRRACWAASVGAGKIPHLLNHESTGCVCVGRGWASSPARNGRGSVDERPRRSESFEECIEIGGLSNDHERPATRRGDAAVFSRVQASAALRPYERLRRP